VLGDHASDGCDLPAPEPLVQSAMQVITRVSFLRRLGGSTSRVRARARGLTLREERRQGCPELLGSRCPARCLTPAGRQRAVRRLSSLSLLAHRGVTGPGR
jgi:hypothetical protein